MCIRGNRRSRRVSNYRTRVWVNQYNNVENNYGTVINVAEEVDECEQKKQPIDQEYNLKAPGIAIQVINVQHDEQPSTLCHESVQESGEAFETSNTSVIRNLVIGVVLGVICKGIYSFNKNSK